MTKRPPSKWDLHLENDRRRSQAYRVRSREIGRPNPGQVDRAIAEALHVVWAAKVQANSDGDIESVKAATGLPINGYKVAETAIQILVDHKRADRTEAARMVMRRLRPRPADKITISTRGPAATYPL